MYLFVWVYIIVFMKKNTLLYLDKALVESAKQANLNISALTEEALERALSKYSPQTAREYLQIALASIDQIVTPYSQNHLLPFQIQSLALQNIGMFRDFKANFRKDELNIIYGSKQSGKTTIIHSILQALRFPHNYFSKSENGRISLTLFPDQQTININTYEKNSSDLPKGYKCLVMDDFLPSVNTNMMSELIEEMQNLKIQVIATATDPLKFPKNIHVISLPKPE